MPKFAATVGDHHICPKVEPGPKPHVGGPILNGSPDIFIGGQPAARKGDQALCIGGAVDTITEGSSTVFFNGKPAARFGDRTQHGGRIVTGNPTVIIGDGYGTPELSASANLDHIPPRPTTADEARQRLDVARTAVEQALRDGTPLPPSFYSTEDKLKLVEDNVPERFIVRIIESAHAGDNGTIGKPGVQPANYWTATFSQIEHADHNARLLCELSGIPYDPEIEYTMLIIDREQAEARCEMESFYPTREAIVDYLEKEALKDEKLAPVAHLIDEAMKPAYSYYYESLHEQAMAKRVNLDEPDQLLKLAADLGFDAEEADMLRVRHQLKGKFGCNEQFLGCGLTNDINADNAFTPFGPVQEDTGYGIVEVFTYDKKPRKLRELEELQVLCRIPLKNYSH